MANMRHLESLQRSVEAWNTWRDEHKDIRPDLNRVDLYRANLSDANLKDVNLSEADLRGANLTGASLTRAYFNRLGIPILRRPSRPHGPREKYMGNHA